MTLMSVHLSGFDFSIILTLTANGNQVLHKGLTESALESVFKEHH